MTDDILDLPCNHYPVGAIVYVSYRPKKVGKILGRIIDRVTLNSQQIDTVDYRIRWEDGRKTTESSFEIRLISDLIEQHEKALVTHRASLKRGMDIPGVTVETME